MTDSFPIDNPPQVLLLAAPSSREREALEKSVVREAITECLEGGAPRLMRWLDRIEEQKGAKAAFDSFIKLLEFGMPKLQRVTVQDPNVDAVQMPVINVSFAQPSSVKIIEVENDG